MDAPEKISFTTRQGQELLVNKNIHNLKAARAAGWKETIRMNAQKNTDNGKDEKTETK